MTPSTNSRVVPQQSGRPSQSLAGLEDQNEIVGFFQSGPNHQIPFPAAKAWVSEAVPPTSSGDSDDFGIPVSSKVHYYRQRHDDDDDGETSALVAWISGLLCIPRTGSGRFRSLAGRESSVDSVDFVSTWQKAQADAAARRVVPVLKRPNDMSVSNTPEFTQRDLSPAASCVTSMRGQPGIEARSSRTISGQRASSSCGFALSPAASRNDRTMSCGGQRASSSCGFTLSGATSSDEVQSLEGLEPQLENRQSSRPGSKRSVRFN